MTAFGKNVTGEKASCMFDSLFFYTRKMNDNHGPKR